MDPVRQPVPQGPFLPLLLLVCMAVVPWVGCSQATISPPEVPGDQRATEEALEVVFLHMNDVYEIQPIQAGAVGGIARVAGLREELLAGHPLVVTTLGGDLLSPSAMGTAKVEGERLAGRQMVAALNAAGLDVATLGNHEFDLSRDELVARLGEAEFRWVASNVTWADGTPLPHVVDHEILTLTDPGSGREVRIGILGAVLASGAPGHVLVSDPLASLEQQALDLRGQVDLLVALTHLELEDDVLLAERVPAIDLVLGGHDHENWQIWRGLGMTPILKADANARTVYVVEVDVEPGVGAAEITPELVAVNDSIGEEPGTAAVVERWAGRAFDAFRADGFEPEEVVADVPVALDGREGAIRSGQTELTRLVADAFLERARQLVPETEAAIYNAGSIRIDDLLPPGPLTQYDVLRILPFGGELVVVEIAGGFLEEILDQGLANAGSGGYLQWSGIGRTDDGDWTVAGAPLTPARTYVVALNDFLLSGRERGLGQLMPGYPDLQILRQTGAEGELRRSVIDELRQRYGSAGASPGVAAVVGGKPVTVAMHSSRKAS